MRKLLLILLVIVSCTLVVAPKAQSQHVYLGMYWIAGGVSDPDGVGTEGRRVCFFKELDNNQIIGGYADDYVGTAGLAGRANQHMLNAFEDWRLSVSPGKYYVAIVQGNDGYGADPVEVTVTGQGYDIAPDLVLAKGAGIAPPADRPDLLAEMLPRFEDIRFGKRKYQPVLVAKGQEFIVSSQPRISAKAVSSFGLNVSQIAMVMNEGAAEAKTFAVKSSHIVKAAGPAEAPTEVDFVFDFSAEKETLPEGEQNLTFKASNIYGTTVEVCTVVVAGGEPRLIGVPVTFPSPLRLKTDKEAIFQYTLSHDINIEIDVFDVSARVVRRVRYNAREEGGSAGVNKVTWDLITDQGQIVSSGIYVFTIINRDNGKLLGKGKFTALP